MNNDEDLIEDENTDYVSPDVEEVISLEDLEQENLFAGVANAGGSAIPV